jgi:TIR domain/WD domain, G-beta repeat
MTIRESSENFAFDVFLSHNSKDKDVVRRLAEHLHENGLRVWFDEWVLRPGDDIYLGIERGLQLSKTCILCLSAAALGSHWVDLERSTVLFRDPSNINRRFIPVLIADCQLPDSLRRYKHIDFRDRFEAALGQLVDACRDTSETDSYLGTLPRSMSDLPTPEVRLREEKDIDMRWTNLLTDDRINDFVITPDSTKVVAALRSKTAMVFYIRSGNRIADLSGHTGSVNSVCICGNGTRIVTASSDNTLRVWSAHDFGLIGVLSGHHGSVSKVVRGTSEREVVSISEDKTIRVWDVPDAKQSLAIEIDSPAKALDLVPGSGTVISGHRNGEISIWSLKDGERKRRFSETHDSEVQSVKASPDGLFGVSSAEDHILRVWNFASGSCMRSIVAHRRGPVSSLDISHDGALVASVGRNDGFVMIRHPISGKSEGGINTNGRGLTSVRFAPDRSRILFGCISASIGVWSI